MFDKLKKIKELNELRGKLKEEKVEIKEKGARVVINGNLEIEIIELDNDLEKEEQEKVLRDCLNKAIKEIQLRIAKTIPLSSLGL